ncbi:hypothetical protein vseg_001536 [Gypsophila vaccaria]
MADLSDDISSLLHTLLQNSSQPSTSPGTSNPHESTPRQPGSAEFSDHAGLFEGTFGFSGGYYTSGIAASLGLSMDDINEADCESEGQEERRGNPAPGRSSSKRSRAAEVHNLSEKRRRQRINEKMKALQKLIPNSNKTDKASMLDEAIEYLKQLQLQVQMLTIRNGSSLHPFCVPGMGQPMHPPPIGQLIDDSNSNRGIGSFSTDPEVSIQAMFDLASKPGSFDYKLHMPRMLENDNSGPSLALESSAAYRPFNSSMPSKVLCKDPALPHLQLDMSQYGQSSSSGISS